MNQERKLTDIIWREDLYPRFEPVPERIQQYAECIDLLPPIEINQRNELIDGYHRWTAHKKEDRSTITVIVTPTASDAELDRLMVRRNADFGIQLSQDEKQRKARQWFQALTDDVEQIATDLSVSERTVRRWVSRRIKDMKAERDRRIADMWLACYTEEEIAAAAGISERTVPNAIESAKQDTWQKLRIFSDYQEPEWKPPIYDVWKVQDKSNATSHFGNTEAQWIDNLIYLYTDPFGIVVDPFAGGGSTIDVCKRRLRRYWASDRLPIVERRDIREWDILGGSPPLHKRWGDVALMYLDPPYWKQAEGRYSADNEDLANMDLERFYQVLCGFIRECAGKMHSGAKIALIIQPTQWKAPGRQVVDHVMDLIDGLRDAPMCYVRRISAPYESQQCTAQMVEWAKGNREVLVISREIIIWEVT
ncbi:MAG TPA: DNA methyltransferase [Sedimentisphaerales bacterium]|nr:DNA methyltransferase [Sedimentisphaerales bacterium]